MRWMLSKDLLILRRSRLLVALLVIYPVAISLLIGFAISRAPAKPRVAVLDLTPPGASVELGSRRVSVGQFYGQLFRQVQAVKVSTRAQARGDVASGRVLAAVVIPADLTERLSSATTQAQVQVIYNGDALQQSFARSTIESALAQANLALSNQIVHLASRDIDLLLAGGNLGALGVSQELLGLSHIPPILHRVVRHQPPGPDRDALSRVAGFADFAARNLGLSKDVLATVGQPIQVRETLLHGRRTPLDDYAVVVAVSISMMFVCVLLAAGGVALEREEHTMNRLLRGLVSHEALLTEKLLLAAGCAFVAALVTLAGIGAFVGLDWSRVGLWLLALAFGALAFAALGVAIGALAREVRAATLLAFLLSLPLAFLALVPGASVASGLYDVIRVVSALFPFKAALQALDAAVNDASPGVWVSVAHLAGLTALFGTLARVGLSRST
jgi:ABC-type transport system involved in cytochrome c biogenesis permease component